MVLNRLKWVLGPLHKNIFGFRAKRGTADAVATFITQITEVTERNAKRTRAAFAVFIDLEKAFELADITTILHLLAERDIEGNMLGWIASYLSSRQARVRYQGQYSGMQTFQNGTPQGGVLSPTLFNLLMDQVVSQAYPNGVQVCSYADDLVMTSTGPHAYKNLSKALGLLDETCKDLGLKISVDKTKAEITSKEVVPTKQGDRVGQNIPIPRCVD